jgi:flagellar assembly protein FliH
MPGIIKAGTHHSNTDALQSAAFNFEDISDKANHYLDAVRRQATKILTDAKQQAAEAELRAKEQGRQAALREAEQTSQVRLEEQLQSLWPALDKAIAALRQSEQAWLKHWECRTVQLACAIAERIIRRELAQTPAITLSLVREALELAMGSSRIRLHLHPDDQAALGEQLSALLSHMEQLAPTEVTPDPAISRGGCRVVTEFGSVDQQLETQLARIERELT